MLPDVNDILTKRLAESMRKIAEADHVIETQQAGIADMRDEIAFLRQALENAPRPKANNPHRPFPYGDEGYADEDYAAWFYNDRQEALK